MTSEQMKAAFVNFFDEMNKGNLDIMDKYLTPGFISYGGAGFQDLHGRDAFKDLYRTFIAAFPDLMFQIDDMIVEGNLLVAPATITATHLGNFMGFAPPTGNKVTWTAAAIFQFTDEGQIDARWQEWDGVSLMQQMGLIPAQNS